MRLIGASNSAPCPVPVDLDTVCARVPVGVSGVALVRTEVDSKLPVVGIRQVLTPKRDTRPAKLGGNLDAENVFLITPPSLAVSPITICEKHEERREGVMALRAGE